jgi:hypothetical protein
MWPQQLRKSCIKLGLDALQLLFSATGFGYEQVEPQTHATLLFLTSGRHGHFHLSAEPLISTEIPPQYSLLLINHAGLVGKVSNQIHLISGRVLTPRIFMYLPHLTVPVLRKSVVWLGSAIMPVVMGMSNNPTCRNVVLRRKPQYHILCECEALVSLRHAHLGSFFLDPEDIRKLIIGSSGTLLKELGPFDLV